MPLPDTYSELYPGRFLKADLFKGRKVTLTINKIDVEELHGEKGREPKVVVSFAETKREYVMPKTCGECLRRMFGNNPHSWLGKRVTWYPTTTRFGKENVDCIRVWGSPDIEADMQITVPQGRKKPLEMTMHKVVTKGESIPTPKPETSSPDATLFADAFEALGMSENERNSFLVTHAGKSDEEIRSILNEMADEAA